MSDPKRDPLDEMLAKLPQAIAPERDLWPAIDAQLTDERNERRGAHRPGWRWYQLAAALLLVVGTTLTVTMLAVRHEAPPLVVERQSDESAMSPQAVATPASFDGYRLDDDYLRARAQLDAAFELRLKTLPPAAREKVERNLADIRAASREIADTLAQYPADPLLQELLLSTYQSELQLLTDVALSPSAQPSRVEL